jgi:undecaprenyl diphosphate synthase
MGGQTLVDFVQWCMEDKIKTLTVYAFSTENWNRDENEIRTLMMIISKYADSFKQEAISRNIKVNILATGTAFHICCILYVVYSM